MEEKRAKRKEAKRREIQKKQQALLEEKMKQQEEELQEFDVNREEESQAMKGALHAVIVAAKLAPQGPSAEEQALLREQERIKQEMLARQTEQLRKLEEEAEKEERETLAAREKQMEERKQKALEQKKREMEARLAAAQSSANTAEEIEAMKKAHEEELILYAESIDVERERQNEKLKKKLEAKRAKKRREAQKKNQEDLEKELEEQKREAEELKKDREKEEEKNLLMSALQVVPEEEIEEAIELVLEQRHSKETTDMLRRHYVERSQILRDALESLFQEKIMQRNKLQKEMNAEGRLPEEINAAIKELELQYEAKQNEVEHKVRSEVEARHAEELLELRQRQLNEISDAFKQLAPEDVLKRKQMEDASREAEEIEAFRRQMEKDREERIRRIQEEKNKMEDEIKHQNEEELKKIEKEHEDRIMRERKLAEEQMQARRALMLKEQEEMQK